MKTQDSNMGLFYHFGVFFRTVKEALLSEIGVGLEDEACTFCNQRWPDTSFNICVHGLSKHGFNGCGLGGYATFN